MIRCFIQVVGYFMDGASPIPRPVWFAFQGTGLRPEAKVATEMQDRSRIGSRLRVRGLGVYGFRV